LFIAHNVRKKLKRGELTKNNKAHIKKHKNNLSGAAQIPKYMPNSITFA
jgi:hypothetical protein